MLAPVGAFQTAIDRSIGERTLLRAKAALGWRTFAAAVLLALALGLGLPRWLAVQRAPTQISSVPHSHAFTRMGLLSLPSSARGPVSAVLGAQGIGYTITPSSVPGTFRATSSLQRLQSTFTRSGVLVRSGKLQVGLSLAGIGFGSSLRTVPAVAPTVKANRVSYQLPGLREWFTNGPLGLEQGFTVSQAPSSHASGPLTLALTLSGDAHAVLSHHAVVLSRGGSTLLYTGLSVTDASGRPLHAGLALHGGKVVIAVAARGARYPLRIDPFVQQGSKLTGGSESGPGFMGYSVALSENGNTALIGGPYDTETGRGAAWIFERSGSTWVQGPKLAPSTSDDAFGESVALDAAGDTALISSPGTEVKGVRAGTVWVYKRSGSTWSPEGAPLTAKEESGEGAFGESVALSANGTTALIGGSGDNGGVGAAWVFTWEAGKWKQQGKKLIGAESVGDPAFGESVALSAEGDTALVGGPYDATYGGAVWVFTRSGSTWSEQGPKLGSIGAGVAFPLFGRSVALSADGDTALIGGPGENSAWVYTRSGATWIPQGERLAGPRFSSFGYAVGLSALGNTAVIGAPGFADAYEYTRSGETWTQQSSTLTGTGGVGENGFAEAVAVSGDGATALVGAPEDKSSSGATWAFVSGPEVQTDPASEVTTTTAHLNATVDPQGRETTSCKFEYGPTTAYGKTAACSPSPSGSKTAIAVSAALTGLSVNSTYHFRVSVADEWGTNEGTDQTFTTLATSKSAETKEEAKPAEATDGQLSATASSGTGTVTVGPYGTDIGGRPLRRSTGKYFDVYHSSSSTFKNIEIKDCELGGGKSIWWENPENGRWEPIAEPPAKYTEGSPPCVTVTLTESTHPSVAQLTGTRYGTRYGDLPGSLEYGKCEATKHGYYADADCTVPDLKGGVAKGKYEWYANPVGCYPKKHGYYSESSCLTQDVKKGAPKGKYESGGLVEFNGSGGTAKFEMGSETLECSSSASQGALTGPRAATDKITFHGCKLGANECTTGGAVSGTIETVPLELFIEDEGSGADTEIFGAPIATFACAGKQYTIQGGALGETLGTVNAMSTASEATFKTGAGEQELETVVGTERRKTTMTLSYKLTSTQEMEIATNRPPGTGG